MHEFRTLTLSKQFYKDVKRTKVKSYVRDQLYRATFSICLNLSEGNNRRGGDRRRLFTYALTSLREVQTIIEVEELDHLSGKADQLGASLYRLTVNCY